jgi:hypothetical protein
VISVKNISCAINYLMMHLVTFQRVILEIWIIHV